MQYVKKKNGYIITVKEWDNKVTVSDTKGNVIKTETFNDHVKAVIVAQAL